MSWLASESEDGCDMNNPCSTAEFELVRIVRAARVSPMTNKLKHWHANILINKKGQRVPPNG